MAVHIGDRKTALRNDPPAVGTQGSQRSGQELAADALTFVARGDLRVGEDDGAVGAHDVAGQCGGAVQQVEFETMFGLVMGERDSFMATAMCLSEIQQ